MIFEELVLQNFRQFGDQQTLRFATDKHTNVTVIHGFNGAGKTTLLNAFTWLIYEKFTPDFVDTDRLETEAAFAQLERGGEVITSAKLTFEDRGRRYIAERRITVGKTDEGVRVVKGPAELSLKFIDEAGEVQEAGNPQDYLERLIPAPLMPFFFFNGERIEKLAGPDAYSQIESGVKVLLDIELFDRAISHLDGDVSRRLRQEIASHSGQEGERVQKEYEQLKEKLNKTEESIEQLEKNRDALLAERETIDTRLNAMPELAKLQAQREEKEKQLTSVKQQIKDRRGDLARALSRSGYLVLVPDVLTKANEILTAAHEKGELPIKIKRQFVDELLEKGFCICNREIIPGTEPHDCVTEWRNRAGSEALAAIVTVTKAEIDPLLNRREHTIQDIDRLQEERDNLGRSKRLLEEELSELSSKIGRREHGEDPMKLEARRRQIDRDFMQLGIDLHDLEAKKTETERLMREKDAEIKNIAKADAQGQLAQRRLSALTNVKMALQKIRAIRHDELRKDLSRRLGEVWGRISIKDYQANVDDRYHLHLTKDVGGSIEPVRGASTGEKQVLSLAFIGSLVDKARVTYERAGTAGADFFQGGLYPLVMDSPFGSLEDEYRRDVAKWIPTLAPQVVVLVSKTQWRREVEEELHSKIGREWVLMLSTPKNRPASITVRGREYDYVVSAANGFESTTLKEVEL